MVPTFLGSNPSTPAKKLLTNLINSALFFLKKSFSEASSLGRLARTTCVFDKDILRISLLVMGLMAPVKSVKVTQEGKTPFNVVVSIRPLHSLVAALMKGRGYPHLLIDMPICSHDHGWRFSDAGHLQKASMIIWIGSHFEGQKIYEAIHRQITSHSVNGHKTVDNILRLKALMLTDFSQRLNLTNRSASSSDPIYDGHFFWDPIRMKEAARIIAEVLMEADSSFKTLYQDNLAQVLQQLGNLHRELLHLSDGIKNLTFWACHSGYEYFFKRYGLGVQGVLIQDHHNHLMPSHLARLKKASGAHILLEKSPMSSKLATWLEKYGYRIIWIEGLGGHTQKPGHDLYVTLMKKLMMDIVEGLTSASVLERLREGKTKKKKECKENRLSIHRRV